MNSTTAIIALASTALACCDPATKEDDKPKNESSTVIKRGMHLPEPWFNLEYSLNDYIKMQPERPMIVSFGAHWGELSEYHWRILYSDAVTTALRASGVLCLVGDLTEADADLAKSEMNGLERVAVPVTALYDPVVGTWRVMPEIFSATEIEQWASSLKSNTKQNQPDMATPNQQSD